MLERLFIIVFVIVVVVLALGPAACDIYKRIPIRIKERTRE